MKRALANIWPNAEVEGKHQVLAVVSFRLQNGWRKQSLDNLQQPCQMRLITHFDTIT